MLSRVLVALDKHFARSASERNEHGARVQKSINCISRFRYHALQSCEIERVCSLSSRRFSLVNLPVSVSRANAPFEQVPLRERASERTSTQAAGFVIRDTIKSYRRETLFANWYTSEMVRYI